MWTRSKERSKRGKAELKSHLCSALPFYNEEDLVWRDSESHDPIIPLPRTPPPAGSTDPVISGDRPSYPPQPNLTPASIYSEPRGSSRTLPPQSRTAIEQLNPTYSTVMSATQIQGLQNELAEANSELAARQELLKVREAELHAAAAEIEQMRSTQRDLGEQTRVVLEDNARKTDSVTDLEKALAALKASIGNDSGPRSFSGLRPQEFGYFHPNYIPEGSKEPTTKRIINEGSVSIYVNPMSFLARCEDLATAKSAKIVIAQLPLVMRGEAAEWYANELTDINKQTIRDDSSNNLVVFADLFRKRFKLPVAQALDIFYGSKYTIQDAREGKHIRGFLSLKYGQAQDASIQKDHQLLQIWNLIAPIVQKDLGDPPTESTTYSEFRERLETRGTLLLSIYHPQGKRDAWSSPNQVQDIARRPPAGGPIRGGLTGSGYSRSNTFQPVRGGTLGRGSGRGGPVGYNDNFRDGRKHSNPLNLLRPCRWCSAKGVENWHLDSAHATESGKTMVNWNSEDVIMSDDGYGSVMSSSPEEFSDYTGFDDTFAMQQQNAYHRTHDAGSSERFFELPNESTEWTPQFHGDVCPDDTVATTKSATDYLRLVAKKSANTGLSLRSSMKASTDLSREVSSPEMNQSIDSIVNSNQCSVSNPLISTPPRTVSFKLPTDADIHYDKDDSYQSDESTGDRVGVPLASSLKLSAPRPSHSDLSVDKSDTVDPTNNSKTCAKCKQSFPTRNALHKHLSKYGHHERKSSVYLGWFSDIAALSGQELVRSSSDILVGNGLEYEDYDYAKVKTQFLPDGPSRISCIDSGTGLSSIDEQIVASHPEWTILESPKPIYIRGMGNETNISNSYVKLELCLPNEHGETAMLKERHFHLVKTLPCGILIGNDVSYPEKIRVDLRRQFGTVETCISPRNGKAVRFPVLVTRKRACPDTKIGPKRVLVSRAVRLPPGTTSFVSTMPIKHLKSSRSYHFSGNTITRGAKAIDCMHNNTSPGVLFTNNSDCVVQLQRGSVIGTICEWDRGSEAMEMQGDFAALMMNFAESGASLKMEDRSSQSVYASCHVGDSVSKDSPPKPKEKPWGSKHVLVNTEGPTEYEQRKLRGLVEEFPELWQKDLGLANEPESEWLEIPVRPDANLKCPGLYKNSERDKALIDETFDPLAATGRLIPGRGSIAWPVFVVWNKGKGRVVVDLRGLNRACILDAYPLPAQDEIMSLLRGKKWITCIDVRASFYQRRIKPGDRHKMQIISHRGLEQFTVASMGFLNSPAHGQRFMDGILAEMSSFAKCYVDDIVIFSDTFEEHLRHLRLVFDALRAKNITLAPEKCFVGYQSVELLGHVVDRLGLYTMPSKVAAIQRLEFPKSLDQLEHFLGLSGYYRHFVYAYARIARPLQSLKTALLKNAPVSGHARKTFCAKTTITAPSEQQKMSFEMIKDILSNKIVLRHHDPSVPLIYRVDASFEVGVSAIVCQITREDFLKHSLEVSDIVEGKHDRKLERPVVGI